MGFQNSSMFKGVEDHKPTDRDPKLPVGRHTVQVKNAVRFLSRSDAPVCIAQVTLLSSDNGSAIVGETYAQGFFYNKKMPYYFFTEIKKFVMAATELPDEEITQDLLEKLFTDRDNPSEKSDLIGLKLCVVIEKVMKDGVEREKSNFRPVPQA